MKIIRTLFFFVIFSASFVNHQAVLRAEFTEKILAVVNGEAITQTDIDEILTPIYLQYKNSYRDEELNKKMETARKDILNQMITDKIILQEAKRQEVKVEEKEVEKMIDEIKSNFPSEDDFLNALNNQNMSLNTLKKRYRDQLLIRKTVEKQIVSKITVSPSEIADYYDKNKEKFRTPEEIHLKDILIKTTAANEEEVKKKAAGIYEQLKKGAEFAEMVEKYSEDANVVDGGDMGVQKRDSLHAGIEEAVSKLKPGEFSEPVKTSAGYYIFKVEEKIKSYIMPLEKIQEQVKMGIRDSKLKQKLDEWIEGLKKSSLIEVKTNEEKS